MARIQRQRRRVQKNFSLTKYGTWEAAEAAGLDWLSSLTPSLPKKVSSKNRMTARNHSGVVGIHFDSGERILKSGNRADYPCYVARWPSCKAGLRWMLSTYNGPEMAFIHAYICRQLETKDRKEIEETVRKLTSVERENILKLRNENGA